MGKDGPLVQLRTIQTHDPLFPLLSIPIPPPPIPLPSLSRNIHKVPINRKRDPPVVSDDGKGEAALDLPPGFGFSTGGGGEAEMGGGGEGGGGEDGFASETYRKRAQRK
jgi:hypothetical protein